MKRTILTLGLATLTGVLNARDVDDQIRYATYSPYFHDLFVDMGFNFFSWGGGKADLEKGTAEIPDAPYEREVLRRLANEGAEVIVNFGLNRNPCLDERFARVGRDGRRLTRANDKKKRPVGDPSHPGCAELIENAARALGKAYADLGEKSLVGFRGVEEVRLHSQPSFAPENHAAYRAYAGVDIPAEAQGRAAPHWSKIKDFPADRIVDEEFPLLKYYRWFWQQGDGWAGANDAASRGFAAGAGARPVVSVYAPVLRMPFLWGIGGHNSHLAEWTYLTPFPFNIRYQIAEMQASARGTGAAIIPGVDGVIRTGVVLPPKRNPDPLPDWYRPWEGTGFVTVPPDWAREAFWLMCSRRSEGIALAVATPVVGLAPGASYWAPKTNDETCDAVREVMQTLAVPLGPLLKNMPERAPEVAILESYASVILSGQAPWDWRTTARSFGELAALANLDQYALFEEEIARDGIPPSVRAILLPDCPVLTKTTAAKLREFQARGGRLVASKTLAPGLKADAQLPAFEKVLPESRNQKGEAEGRERAMRATAAAIKATLGFPLFAESDNDALLLSVRSSGSADVVFAVNDRRTYGDYIGPWKMAMDKGAPNRGEIRLRRAAGAVYDLVRHVSVPFACEGEVTRIPVAYETCDGKALLVAARPLSPLAVSARDGRLSVTSADKDVMLPFGVYARNGKLVVAGILRDGAWERPLPPDADEVVNFATGERTPVVPRLAIGMSGFSKAVCNEAGVRRLKDIGADFASGVRFDDTATLDLFQKYGLRAVVSGLPGWWGGGKKNAPGTMAEKRPVAAFEKALETFRPHFAMRAITLGDEPSKLDFAHFGKVSAAVAARCGGVKPCTPIFPDYGSLVSIGDEAAKRQLGTDSYEDYVTSWCASVPTTAEVCIDFYPYSAPAETRASYFLRRFRTQGIGATCAKACGKPLALYVQANSLVPDFEMTLPRLRYLAYTALAYGPSTLKFTCYTPSFWTNNILTVTGEPTARYYAVQRLIRELRAFDAEYMGYAWLGTRYIGFSEAELAAIGGSAAPVGYETPYATIRAKDGVKCVVGDFIARDGSGLHAVLIARADDPEGGKGAVSRVGVVATRRPIAVGPRGRVMPVQDKKNGAWSYPVAADGCVFVKEVPKGER